MISKFFSDINRAGVLGMNQRNLNYIQRWNPREAFPLVDDKLVTKQLCLDANIAVPELYGVIAAYHEVRDLETLLGTHEDFALKPAGGSGGEGIIIIESRQKDRFRKPNGAIMRRAELEDHISQILGGVYSLGGQPDKVILEYRVKFDPIFDPVSYLGVPDIRIIVFLGVPVMAMVRLPTRQSDGKANLHKGAIGAGIDIGTGITLGGVCQNIATIEHPDTGNPVAGVEIPHWERLLTIASGCYDITKLGYLGVDIVLDRDRGPLLLELNARPGLSIQIANNAGLLPRLQLTEEHLPELSTLQKRITFAQEMFRIAAP
jgi:alpha-L-glutamate ligase-like protein